MEMSNCLNMDANILLGIANDRLRHECQSIESLAALMDVDQQQLKSKFSEIGFHYETGLNQFMPDLG